MSTYVDDNDNNVDIVDLEGLNKYIQDFKDGKFPEFKEHEHLLDGISIDEKSKQLKFGGMNGWKIISYWYDHLVLFLRDLAVFVEGKVYLSFETEDEGGRIEFHDGECIIHTGQMKWEEHKPEDFFAHNNFDGSKKTFVPLRQELKERLLARQI